MDSNERGRPASTMQSTAIVATDGRLLHEKPGLRAGHTIDIEGGQHWRKTLLRCVRVARTACAVAFELSDAAGATLCSMCTKPLAEAVPYT